MAEPRVRKPKGSQDPLVTTMTEEETPEWKNIGLLVLNQIDAFDKKIDTFGNKVDDLPAKLAERLEPKFDRLSKRIDRNHSMIISYGVTFIILVAIGLMVI